MKMFKTLLLLAVAMAARAGFASPLVSETPIREVGTPTTVSVSQAALTKVPTTQSLDGQSGYIVSTSSSTSYMSGQLGNCTSAPAATSVRPLSFIPGTFVVIPAADNVCLWVLNLGAGAENMHVQEFKQ